MSRNWSGAFARIASSVPAHAYERYRMGATPSEMRTFHVASTSRAAILTRDAASASASAFRTQIAIGS